MDSSTTPSSSAPIQPFKLALALILFCLALAMIVIASFTYKDGLESLGTKAHTGEVLGAEVEFQGFNSVNKAKLAYDFKGKSYRGSLVLKKNQIIRIGETLRIYVDERNPQNIYLDQGVDYDTVIVLGAFGLFFAGFSVVIALNAFQHPESKSKMESVQLLLALTLVVGAANPVSAEKVLFGGVSVNTELPRMELKALVPIEDKAGSDEKPLPKQDCVCFRRANLEIREIDGALKIVDGDNWLLDFARSKQEAEAALKLIDHYQFDNMCFVGRPFKEGQMKMMYFLSDGQAPSGSMDGEDAVSFDNKSIEAKLVKGTWKIVEGDHWILDFGSDEHAARSAAEIIRYYGFSHQAYVGRPGPSVMYFRK